MAVGLLEVHGSIDISQFWPTGRSDADTAKVVVQLAQDAFQFRPHPNAPFHTTAFWQGAKVKGSIGLKAPIDNHDRLTIRLQGIDAPELHYQPHPLTKLERNESSAEALARYKALNHFYRQPFGATATDALRNLLVMVGQPLIPCRVWTQVAHPSEIFDTYARFVGNIDVTIGGKSLDLNYWLIEQGWAFPAFYSSMSHEEIVTVSGFTKTARSKKYGVWKYQAKTIDAFDFNLLEPAAGDTSVLEQDQGQVLFPKLFRRQCSWATRKKAGISKQTLQQYLEANADACFKTSEFLTQSIHSAQTYPFASFIKAGKSVLFEPDDLVFQELPSKLLGADGKEVVSF